jgi:uncharacterized protein (TIGR02246 family)
MVPAILVLVVTPLGAQQAGDTAAREELLKTDREWAQTAATKDVERIVSYWADDAVIYAPGEAPVEGKEAIRQFVAGSLNTPGFAITWTPMRAEVSTSGDLAFTTGTNAITLPAADGRPTTLQGRYVTVWRKGKDGRWHCVVDSWSPAPAANPK